MADLLFKISTEGTEVALVATTAKTVLQVRAPTNQRLRLKAWSISFDGIVVTDPAVQVKLLRQTTNGTMTTVTPRKVDDDIATSVQSTAGKNATAEPTAGDVLDVVEVHPQLGFKEVYPLGDEWKIGGGDRIGIECTAPDAVNCEVWMKVEE